MGKTFLECRNRERKSVEDILEEREILYSEFPKELRQIQVMRKILKRFLKNDLKQKEK